VEWPITNLKLAEFGPYGKIAIATLRHLNQNGEVDEILKEALLRADGLGATLRDLLANVRLTPALALGDIIYDISAEGWTSKPVTYFADPRDINLALIRTFERRPAAVQCGPVHPNVAPQVVATDFVSTLSALQTRLVTAPIAEVDEDEESRSWRHFHSIFDQMMAMSGVEAKVMSYRETIDSMPWSGAQKRQARLLIPEIDGCEEKWLTESHLRVVQAFSKRENLGNKATIDPRLIQGFLLGYSIITARVVKSVYKALKPVFGNPDCPIVIGSMMTAEARGRWHKRQIENGYQIQSLDGSAYDSTTRRVGQANVARVCASVLGFAPVGLAVVEATYDEVQGVLVKHGYKYKLPRSNIEAGQSPELSGRATTTLGNSLNRAREGLWYIATTDQVGAVMSSGDDLDLACPRALSEQHIIASGRRLGRLEKLEPGCIFLRQRDYPVGGELIPGVMIGRILCRMGYISADVPRRRGSLCSAVMLSAGWPLIRMSHL